MQKYVYVCWDSTYDASQELARPSSLQRGSIVALPAGLSSVATRRRRTLTADQVSTTPHSLKYNRPEISSSAADVVMFGSTSDANDDKKRKIGDTASSSNNTKSSVQQRPSPHFVLHFGPRVPQTGSSSSKGEDGSSKPLQTPNEPSRRGSSNDRQNDELGAPSAACPSTTPAAHPQRSAAESAIAAIHHHSTQANDPRRIGKQQVGSPSFAELDDHKMTSSDPSSAVPGKNSSGSEAKALPSILLGPDGSKEGGAAVADNTDRPAGSDGGRDERRSPSDINIGRQDADGADTKKKSHRHHHHHNHDHHHHHHHHHQPETPRPEPDQPKRRRQSPSLAGGSQRGQSPPLPNQLGAAPGSAPTARGRSPQPTPFLSQPDEKRVSPPRHELGEFLSAAASEESTKADNTDTCDEKTSDGPNDDLANTVSGDDDGNLLSLHQAPRAAAKRSGGAASHRQHIRVADGKKGLAQTHDREPDAKGKTSQKNDLAPSSPLLNGEAKIREGNTQHRISSHQQRHDDQRQSIDQRRDVSPPVYRQTCHPPDSVSLHPAASRHEPSTNTHMQHPRADEALHFPTMLMPSTWNVEGRTSSHLQPSPQPNSSPQHVTKGSHASARSVSPSLQRFSGPRHLQETDTSMRHKATYVDSEVAARRSWYCSNPAHHRHDGILSPKEVALAVLEVSELRGDADEKELEHEVTAVSNLPGPEQFSFHPFVSPGSAKRDPTVVQKRLQLLQQHQQAEELTYPHHNQQEGAAEATQPQQPPPARWAVLHEMAKILKEHKDVAVLDAEMQRRMDEDNIIAEGIMRRQNAAHKRRLREASRQDTNFARLDDASHRLSSSPERSPDIALQHSPTAPVPYPLPEVAPSPHQPAVLPAAAEQDQKSEEKGAEQEEEPSASASAQPAVDAEMPRRSISSSSSDDVKFLGVEVVS